MSESKRRYTRRTTRDRVVALLEEAIQLVKARCLEKGEDPLVKSKRDFAAAVEMKRQANALVEAPQEDSEEVVHASKMPPGEHDSIKGYQHIDKVINIDQTAIGRTPRSNPATYIKVFDEIRALLQAL